MVSATPPLDGDITNYYRHLYSQPEDPGVVGEILAVLDFAVTEAELREILPPIDHSRVARALRSLTPILVENSSAGGYRIFHESFRRYMVDQFRSQSQSLNAVLGPVIDWLQERGFYRDTRAYRFLFPMFDQADRGSEVLELLGHDFVSSIIEHAQPTEAVELNLVRAASIAARTIDWPALARCVELRRAARTAFDHHGSTLHGETYWRTYLALTDVESVGQRLLFEGRPTQPRDAGLIACALVDECRGSRFLGFSSRSRHIEPGCFPIRAGRHGTDARPVPRGLSR